MLRLMNKMVRFPAYRDFRTGDYQAFRSAHERLEETERG